MEISENRELRAADYRSIFGTIIPMKKIVFRHFNPDFVTTVLFEANGEETLLNWTLQFETPEMRDVVVKADEGQQQNMQRLKRQLTHCFTNLQLIRVPDLQQAGNFVPRPVRCTA